MSSYSATSSSLNALLKKTEHYDKDERYMATSDLCEALKRHAAGQGGGSGGGSGASIDAATERRICTAVLKLLDDDSNDVQAIAVKTLGVLLTTVSQEPVLEIADRLCALVLDSSKSELRDVYAIGLRTLVKTVPVMMGDVVSHHLVHRLLDGIQSSQGGDPNDKAAEEISLACLDILTDIITRFGAFHNLTRQHEHILTITLSQLASPRQVVRKRAGTAIGCLAGVLSGPLLARLVESLLSQIDLAEGVGRSGRRRTRLARQSSGGSAAAAPAVVADTRALIRTMCTVTGAVGHRLDQDQIDRIIPIFLRFCDPADATAGDDEEADDSMHDDSEHKEDEAAATLANELRESCFAGFESLVLRCPAEVDRHMDQIILCSLAYMRHDPNYYYGDENAEEGEEDADEQLEEEAEDDEELEDEEEEDDIDDDGDDDDDDSWKVRRSAIRALAAVVQARKVEPSRLWTEEYTWRRGGKDSTVAAALVQRFKEREENCRVDVIDCFTRLLACTVTAASTGIITLKTDKDSDGDASMEDSSEGSKEVVVDFQAKFVPAIVRACEKQLSAKKGGDRPKASALELLSTLSSAPGGVGGASQIRSVFSHVRIILRSGAGQSSAHSSASGVSKSVKLDSLRLVRSMLSSPHHNRTELHRALLDVVLADLCSAVQEDWYKVIAEALRVLAEIPGLVDCDGDGEERKKVSQTLYAAIAPRLAAHDLDQEIKECALTATAGLLTVLHSDLSDEQKGSLLAVLLERLKNETTRLAAMKTLAAVAGGRGGDGTDKVSLSPIIVDAVKELSALLRQQSRTVKQSSLECLNVLIQFHGNELDELAGGAAASADGGLFDTMLKELGAIVADSDLHISHLSLRASMSALKVCPSSGPSVKVHVLPAGIALSTSPLLQDMALDSLLALFKQLVGQNVVDFDELLSSLKARESSTTSKQAIANLAKCIAVITSATTEAKRNAVLADLLGVLESGSGGASAANLQLALLTSGELGRIVDLSASDGVAKKLERLYISCFESTSEEVKQASAHALGRASVGALNVFLPVILQELEGDNEKKQYLLLAALRELIQCYQAGRETSPEKAAGMESSVPKILPHLFSHCGDKEEGIRTMVAECLGSLTCLHPEITLPPLGSLAAENGGKKKPEVTADGEEMQDESVKAQIEDAKHAALCCWTVATSVKIAIAGKVDAEKLSPSMPSFLALLKEEDLSVRNAALLMVYSAVHHSPSLVSGLMQEHILPSLYELAQLNLKRVVDLGPFKHTVDDALPLRKAALSIFATALEKCPTTLDIPAFMPILAARLDDVEDVQLQTHQIVISMCQNHAEHLIAAVETFVEPLEKTVNKKTSQKTGTELERANEWIRSGLRVMIALSRLDGVMNSRKFSDFMDRTSKNSKFAAFFEALEEER